MSDLGEVSRFAGRRGFDRLSIDFASGFSVSLEKKQGGTVMKVISILISFLNSIFGVLLILSCVSAGEALGWIAFKTGAGILAIYFGILTFKDSIQPISQNRLLLSGLFLVIIGVSAFAFGIHWSIVSGNMKLTVLLFGGSMFIQGLTSILGMENPV